MKFYQLFLFSILPVFCQGQQPQYFANPQLIQSQESVSDNFSFFNRRVTVADMDGDGDNDILYAVGSCRFFHENLDGLGNFGHRKTISTNCGSSSGASYGYAKTVDADNDGDLDILVMISDRLYWQENLGAGEFAERVSLSDDLGGLDLEVGDVDGDGDEDLLTEGRWLRKIDDAPTYEPMSFLDLDFATQALYVADVDSDGDIDVISELDDDYFWLENIDGQGNFSDSQELFSSDDTDRLLIYDVDNDGDVDFQVGNQLWRNEGDLSNLEEENLEIGTFTQNTLSAFDLDEDGDLDIMGQLGFNISWCTNVNGSGQFSSKKIIVERSREFTMGDINMDGHLDLIIKDDSGMYWCSQIGNTTQFTAGKAITRNQSHDFIPIDFDNDGDGDFISSGYKPSLIENIDTVGTRWQQNILGSTPRFLPTAVIDFNNDGIYDFYNNTSVESFKWFEGYDGKGTFGPQQIIMQQVPQVANSRAVDITGDGILDILTLSYAVLESTYYLELFRGYDNQNNYHPVETIMAVREYFDIVDIDNDGDMDILIYSSGTSSTYGIIKTDGQGNFAPIEELGLDENSIHPELVDVNGDGTLDIITRKGWYPNDGAGNFPNSPNLFSLSFRNFDLGDIDADGDLDLLGTRYLNQLPNQGELFWLENTDGQGNFGEPNFIVEELSTAEDLTLVDMDGDGDLDILTAIGTTLTGQLSWYANIDGQGNFAVEPYIICDEIPDPRKMEVMDIDLDGDMDVMASSSFNKSLFWFENMDGAGSFYDEQYILDVDERPDDFTLVDMDSDGVLDVLVTIHNEEKIVWFKNNQVSSIRYRQPYNIATLTGLDEEIIIDLDNDGDLDMCGLSGSKIRTFENLNAQGLFSNSKDTDTNQNNEKIFFTDFDDDEDIDALVLSSNGDLGWYPYTINGFFGEFQSIDNNLPVSAIFTTGDFDNDGDMDIVSTELDWYENLDGTSNFSDAIQLEIPVDDQFFNFIEAVDIDKDLDMDFVISNTESIILYENIGLGNFASPQHIYSFPLGEQLSRIYLTDINGDSYKDFAYVNSDATLSWIRNLNGTPFISGVCYFDENQNKMRDSTEIGLLNHQVELLPSEIKNFADSTGTFRFFVDNGNYSLTAQPSEFWALSTDTATYNIIIADEPIENRDFGMYPLVDTMLVEPTIAAANTRCNSQIPFWLFYTNRGTRFTDGMVSLDVPEETSILEFYPAPDSISGFKYFWKFENLPPSYSEKIELLVQIPSVIFIGSFLGFESTTYVKNDDGELIESMEYFYSSEITCAFDPNDKRVVPEGVGDENFTLFGGTLEYTVRFQNTGNDVAFDVRIEDQLDEDLDWTTFTPIAASHNYEVNLLEDGKLEYWFRNIYLPDSTSNEPASHGFLKYRIRPLENLPENTVIENTADIYFDFNPPIQTNTTVNTLVSELPVSIGEKTEEIALKCYPNPLTNEVFFEIEKMGEWQEATIYIRDVMGNIITKKPIIVDERLKIDMNNLPSGVYFYELRNFFKVHLTGGIVIKK